MFAPGKVYRRRDIHALFGGQEQGGISTPADHKVVFVFTGPAGEEYGYSDGWADDGSYHYFGEGQLGDMEFSRGNAAIRDHEKNGKQLHLFTTQGTDSGYVRYVGEMRYVGHHFVQAPDKRGRMRRAIVFHLARVSN